MILQNMTNASAISDEIMSVTFVEPKGTKTPSPAGTSSDTSEASPVKTETPSIPSPEPPLKIKAGTALKPRLKIELPENLTPVAVEDGTKGEGLPYAPEGFPNPEDKWIWKVGKRKNSSGYYGDRYLILPKSLQEGTKQVLFMSKNAAEKYMRKRFPEVDLESFFASFIWPVPSARRHGENGEMIVSSAKRGRKSNVIVHGRTPLKRACNAGNVKCCLETGKGKFYKPMDCDICCVESGFCRECSCILCGMCVDHDLDEYYFIKCQEKLREEFICGHVAHLDCAIICQTGGVVRSNGLDVEYYCRRCDKKTDLLKHVLGLITTPGSGKLRSDVENSLNLALRLIQGTQQTWCRSLENLIQKGVKKLQSGMELQDIFGDAQDNSGTGNADIGYNVKENTPLLKPSNINPIFLSKSGCNGDILCEIMHQENSPVCTSGDINQGTEIISRSPLLSSIRRSGRLQSRTVTPDIVSKKQNAYVLDKFQQKESISEDISTTSDLHNVPAKFRVLEFENMIYQALHILRQSQEREYKIVQEKLFAQKDLVLTLFQQVDEANSKSTKKAIEKAAQKEHEKLVHMLGIADGFNSTSTEFLHDFFGMRRGSYY